jgi:hypothetical protein
MVCGNCRFVCGANYTQDITQVKCSLTDEWHDLNFGCNCEAARQAELLKQASWQNFVDMSYSNTCGPADKSGTASCTPDATFCTRCIICDHEFHLNAGVMVCESCKRAVQFIKEKFKETLSD